MFSTNENTPKYYRSFKLLSLALHPEYRKYKPDKESYPLYNRSTLSRVTELMKIRKMLLLTKAIKFNDKIYSGPNVPGFPSRAYDNMIAKGGLNYFDYGTSKKLQIESAFIAITNKCSLGCSHCYEKNKLNLSAQISEMKLNEVIADLQQQGTNVIILTGGEPLNDFDKLMNILNKGNKDLSDFHLHTSGFSLTLEKAKKLKSAGLTAAAVGFDDVDENREDKIRRKGSYKDAVNALRIFNECGILTYVNLCATKSLIQSGDLFRYLDLVKSLNVSMIQLLEPRPCGGYFSDGKDEFLSEEDKNILMEFTIKANTYRKYKNHPLVYYVAHVEGKKQMGCTMGGLSHFYLDSAGNVNPCVFMPVTFGNINNENFIEIYQKMRSHIPLQIRKECPSLLLSDAITSKADFGLPLHYSKIEDELEKLFE